MLQAAENTSPAVTKSLPLFTYQQRFHHNIWPTTQFLPTSIPNQPPISVCSASQSNYCLYTGPNLMETGPKPHYDTYNYSHLSEQPPTKPENIIEMPVHFESNTQNAKQHVHSTHSKQQRQQHDQLDQIHS